MKKTPAADDAAAAWPGTDCDVGLDDILPHLGLKEKLAEIGKDDDEEEDEDGKTLMVSVCAKISVPIFVISSRLKMHLFILVMLPYNAGYSKY